ncbi:hypothetical protein GCM10025794_01280 [Massilia kyonggiensis]|nr:hypothetical protein [Massilia kyonggiensis]
MAKIDGFGNAGWAVMMSSVSFPLDGTDAYVLVRPADMAGPSPDWWPGKIAQILTRNEPVTADKIRAAFPNLSSVVWDDRAVGFANNVECFGLFDGLRIHINSHLPGAVQPTQEEREKKHAELRMLGDDFIAMIAPRP